jgi:predicted helicase
MTTIQEILAELDSISTDTRHKGDLFENLMRDYLQTEPLYADRFSQVWKWMEWPGRGSMPDTGIDLVAEERSTGGICAIQCKFYAPKCSLQKGDIDSFLATSGKHPFTTRIICSTSNEWSKNAEEAIADQQIPVSRIRIQELGNSSIDWSHFSLKKATPLKLKPKKKPFGHQTTAIEKTLAGFKKSDRGKLIMSCGTGKTFTALKIAESASRKNGIVLFLAPSIALVSQTLREWTAEAASPLRCFAVCSDPTVGKGRDTAQNEDMRAHDLEIPATTNAKWLAYNFTQKPAKSGLTVIFSTYHSIKVLHDAQKHGLPEFDLIICDEAHRTTGVTLSGEDESHFVKVHDAKYIQARKRLYMTATPRVYSDASQTQAKENEAILCSMDDESLYGPEFYYLGFGEAVERKLLTDYKVLVLAVDEKYISRTFQQQLADSNHELKLDDAVKIVGCLNGLSKRMSGEEAEAMFGADRQPMRRAVAFATTIKYSQRVVSLVGEISEFYKSAHPNDSGIIQCEARHVDGKTNIMIRNRLLDWLREGGRDEENTCRLLSNARCLTEGVDVPALDACIFLNPRDSVIDEVQAVGRIMRNAPGKNYGYIIVPVGIPSDMTPEEALKDHKRYKVVWQVLQALRSHDDRFRAMINKIDLNCKPDDHLQVIGVGGGKSEYLLPANRGMARSDLRQDRDQVRRTRLLGDLGGRRCQDRRAAHRPHQTATRGQGSGAAQSLRRFPCWLARESEPEHQ